MTTLIVGDIVQAQDIFEKDKKLNLVVKKVINIYSKPDKDGEVHLERVRYLLKLIHNSWEIETLVDDDQIGFDYILHKRTYPTGIVHTFYR